MGIIYMFKVARPYGYINGTYHLDRGAQVRVSFVPYNYNGGRVNVLYTYLGGRVVYYAISLCTRGVGQVYGFVSYAIIGVSCKCFVPLRVGLQHCQETGLSTSGGCGSRGFSSWPVFGGGIQAARGVRPSTCRDRGAPVLCWGRCRGEGGPAVCGFCLLYGARRPEFYVVPRPIFRKCCPPTLV